MPFKRQQGEGGGVEAMIAEQIEEWALMFQHHYDERLKTMQQEQKETLAIVNRLGKYVNTLEFKINYMSKNLREQPQHDETNFLGSKNDQKFEDIDSRISMLEDYCGYDPEKEAYAALRLGTGELIPPDHIIGHRIEKLEKAVAKLDRNIRQVESNVAGGVRSPDKYTNGRVEYYDNTPIVSSALFLPERGRPKSTNNHSRTPSKDHTVYTPRPPASGVTYDTNGYRVFPSKSRNSPRPTSAPSTAIKGKGLQKATQGNNRQAERDTDNELANLKNDFLMNEMIQKMKAGETLYDQKLNELEANLREYVDTKGEAAKIALEEVEDSLRSKVMNVEATLLMLQRQEDTKSAQALVKKTADQKKAYDKELIEEKNKTQEKEQLLLQKELDVQRKEREVQRELQQQQQEVERLSSENSAIQEENEQLRVNAKKLQEDNIQTKLEYEEQMDRLQKEFEDKRSLVDERTELYKAETIRLKAAHQELQSKLNVEIKERTQELEREKEELEKRLESELSTHNLQLERDRMIKESLQNEIEMFKKSCNHAHQEKDQALSKLKAMESKLVELEFRLQASANENTSPHVNTGNHGTITSSSPVAEERYERIPAPFPRDENGSGHSVYSTPLVTQKLNTSPDDEPSVRKDTPAPQSKKNFFLADKDEETDIYSSPDPLKMKKQKSKRFVFPIPEASDHDEMDQSGQDNIDDDQLKEMVQSKLSKNDINDIIALEEMVKEKEDELNKATLAKSKAKKKIKSWMSDFQRVNNRPPSQSEKEGVSDMYLKHQKLAEERDQLEATLKKMKEALHEKVNFVVE